MKEKMSAYLNLALGMFLCGSAVVVSKMMVSTIPTFLVTELGILIGLLILLPVTFLMKKERYRLDRRTYLILFAQAVCGILLYRIFSFLGLSFTSAANSGLITSASPAVVIILAYVLLKEKISFSNMLGLCLVLVGLFSINLYTYVFEGTRQNSIVGNLLIMVAVVCEALFSVLSKVKCSPMSALYRTTIIVVFAFLGLLPFAVRDAVYYDFSTMPLKTIVCLVYYGVGVSFLSYILWFRGIAKVKASEAAVFTSVVPLSSIFLASVVLKETIVLVHVIGMMFIIAGILVSTMIKNRVV